LYAAFVFGAAAAAGGTANILFYFDVLGNAFGDLFIVELDLYPEVAAPDTPGPGAAATAPPSASEKAAENVVPEDIPELAEDVFRIHAAAGASPAIVEAGMTIAVILGFFIGIAEHFVSFCGFLEFIFGPFITRVAIGVELHGYLTVSLFNIFRRRSF
jgi:hypothetical protein